MKCIQCGEEVTDPWCLRVAELAATEDGDEVASHVACDECHYAWEGLREEL